MHETNSQTHTSSIMYSTALSPAATPEEERAQMHSRHAFTAQTDAMISRHQAALLAETNAPVATFGPVATAADLVAAGPNSRGHNIPDDDRGKHALHTCCRLLFWLIF